MSPALSASTFLYPLSEQLHPLHLLSLRLLTTLGFSSVGDPFDAPPCLAGCVAEAGAVQGQGPCAREPPFPQLFSHGLKSRDKYVCGSKSIPGNYSDWLKSWPTQAAMYNTTTPTQCFITEPSELNRAKQCTIRASGWQSSLFMVKILWVAPIKEATIVSQPHLILNSSRAVWLICSRALN